MPYRVVVESSGSIGWLHPANCDKPDQFDSPDIALAAVDSNLENFAPGSKFYVVKVVKEARLKTEVKRSLGLVNDKQLEH